MVRAKFLCTSVKKFKAWNSYENPAATQPVFHYAYEFQPVTGGSEENKQFFASTPSGSLSLSAVREELFEPGKEYYLDFTPA